MRSKSGKMNITTEFCTFKLEENNDIFLAGGDTLVYLAENIEKYQISKNDIENDKKYPTTFVWGQPFSTCVSYDQW